MKTKACKFPLAGILLLSLASCNSKEPGDDAVATVGGYEITAAELNNEIAALGGRSNRDPDARRQALDQLINRKLLINLAQERNLDQTPIYILNEQRTREMLLADQAVNFLSTLTPAPDERKIADAAQKAGTERIMFQVEGVQFGGGSKPAVIKSIEASQTMEQVRKILTDAKITTSPALLSWDSVAMPPKLVSQLQTVPAGKPFVLSSPSGVFVGVVIGERRQPLAPTQSRDLVKAMMSQSDVQTALADWLQKQRTKTKIVFNKNIDASGGALKQRPAP